jgi:hypothetical protein
MASLIIKEEFGEVVAYWVNCKAPRIEGMVLEFYR